MNSLDLGLFPFEEIRPEQKRVSEQIIRNNDKKYTICELGTGVGKSPLAVMIARSMEKTAIITDSIQLQDQYEKDFSDLLVNVKGQTNYECGISLSEERPCTLDKRYYRHCLDPNKMDPVCPYLATRKKATESHIVLGSYALLCATAWLTEDKSEEDAGFVNQWLMNRKVLVFDEAHLLEKHLVSLCSLKIDIAELETKYKLFKYVNDPVIVEYLRRPISDKTNKDHYLTALATQCNKHNAAWWEDLNNFVPTNMGDSVDPMVYKEINDAKEFENITFILNAYAKSADKQNEWIISIVKDTVEDDRKNTFEVNRLFIQPLKVDWIFDRFFKHRFDKFYFLSATILDPDLFCKTLGLERDESCYITEESSFESRKSPIVSMGCCSTSYQSLQDPANMKQIVSAIEAILQMFPNEKGIIHSGNMKISRYIQDNISSKYKNRLLVRYGKTTNREIFSEHCKSFKPTVLVSSSLSEGVDLKDDLSRFQIIVKMPFLSLGDARINFLANSEKDWYNCDMMKTIIQQAGRSTRNAEDYSYTFVLDKSFKFYIDSANKKGWLTNQFYNRIISPAEFMKRQYLE